MLNRFTLDAIGRWRQRSPLGRVDTLSARALILGLSLCAMAANGAEEGFVQGLINAFESSSIEFPRSQSNAPFLPLGYAAGSHYAQAQVDGPRGLQLEYDVSNLSQAAGLPLMLGDRDMLVVGEYLSWSKFDLTGDVTGSFEASSVGLPVGWLRQLNPRWQLAAFVMPLGHKSNLGRKDWSWQYLGGVFGRYVHNDHLWWVVGAYADVAEGDDFYVPYLGASWVIDERWTLSAIMPWPAITYAPNMDWLLRLGASPSAASWSIEPVSGDVALNMDAWDFGLGVERRIAGSFWLGAEAGVGGFRSLRLSGSDWEVPDVDVGSGPYLSVELKYRPTPGG